MTRESLATLAGKLLLAALAVAVELLARAYVAWGAWVFVADDLGLRRVAFVTALVVVVAVKVLSNRQASRDDSTAAAFVKGWLDGMKRGREEKHGG